MPSPPVAIGPPASRLTYTVFALGLFPVTAEFQDFAGTVSTNRGQHAACAVQMTVRVGSLHMSDQVRQRLTLGPSMLDARQFPTMRYTGACYGDRIRGTLTLHGVTHDLDMIVHREGNAVAATGTIRRADFDVLGLPGLVGQRVRFSLETTLPAALAALR